MKDDSWKMNKKEMDLDIVYSMGIPNIQAQYREGITRTGVKY